MGVPHHPDRDGASGGAAIVAVRLLLHLSQPYVLQGRERSATISLGVASYPLDGDTAEASLASARNAMRRAHAEGGGYRARREGDVVVSRQKVTGVFTRPGRP